MTIPLVTIALSEYNELRNKKDFFESLTDMVGRLDAPINELKDKIDKLELEIVTHDGYKIDIALTATIHTR